ncbi:MAG: glycosyltransferase family 4 protein [Methylococcales symbiont of Hymedesmia sp. n. MRB-2018]|nr:MAG: glycosyltransferase family 4 protein [Methylococcales symbiont of Hymedesmia sp. n. MRB-2018]
MKRALILSPFFYPELIGSGKYNTHLVEEMVRQGYEVDVWCSHPIYPSWLVTESKAEINRVTIIRGGRLNRYPKNVLLRRVVLELWYLCFFLKNMLFCKKVYDVVVPIFPPSVFALLLPLFKHRFSKVFGIVHDLQGVYAERDSGFIKNMVFSLIFFVEKRAFNACDHIAYLSAGMQKTANALYLIKQDKTSVFYPFVTIDAFVDRAKLSALIKDDEKSLVYSGALGEKQNGRGLVALFEAVLARDKSVVAHLFSTGAIFSLLKEEFEFERLVFHDLVDEGDLPELLLRSRVQVIPQAEGSSNGSLPSKLPNLLASGTGIFCITDQGSELIDILEQYALGEVVTSWDVIRNSKILVDMLNKNTEKEVNKILLSKFTKETLVAKILAEGAV